MRTVRSCAFFVVLALMIIGCGSRVATTTAPPPSTPGLPSPSLLPSVSAPATLLAGGVVPFVNEPAGPNEFDVVLPSPTPPPRPSGPRCTTSQLTGTFPTWIKKSSNNDGEKIDPVLAASLYGWVVVTNTSTSACTLKGKVDARLVDATGTIPMDYGNFINSAAAAYVTGLPPGAKASLRLDWSAPFCATVTGDLTVRVALPGGGGTLVAPVTDNTRPGCLHEENHPGLSSGIFISAFLPGDASATAVRPSSPISVLRTSLVSHPARAKAGTSVRYVVALTNPTGTAISLAGSVGFSQFIGSRGGDGVAPYQYSTLYRLNRRVITSIPAHATVRYEMFQPIPPTMTAGLSMFINWLLVAPGFSAIVAPSNGFTLTIA